MCLQWWTYHQPIKMGINSIRLHFMDHVYREVKFDHILNIFSSMIKERFEYSSITQELHNRTEIPFSNRYTFVITTSQVKEKIFWWKLQKFLSF